MDSYLYFLRRFARPCMALCANLFLSATLLFSAAEPAKESLQLPDSTPLSPIELVEQAYSRGEYSSFLRGLDEQYRAAGKAGLIRPLFEKATKARKSQLDQPAPPNKQIQALIKQRNERLLQAIAGNSQASVSRQVQSVIFFLLAPEEEKLLREFDLFKLSAPKNTEGRIENKVASLETQYYIKSLLLEIGHQRSKSPRDSVETKKLALMFEKFDKMEEAARQNDNREWLEKVEKARKLFSLKQTYTADLKALEALALGEVAPQNSVEEKVKEAMATYLSQLNSPSVDSQLAQK